MQRKYSEGDAVAEQILAIARKQQERFPELANVLHQYADSALNQGDKVKAERLAREALALHRKVHGESHPETGWGLFELGRALQEQLKLDEAEVCYREAMTIFRKQYNDSHKSIQYVARALTDVLNAKGDEAGVKEIQDELTTRIRAAAAGFDGDDPQFHIYAAKMALSSGDWPRAIAECSAALVADPELMEGWSIRGTCYLEVKEFAKAANDFTAATQLNPRDWWLWHEQAYALDLAGERAKAIAALTRAIELRDSGSGLQVARGGATRDSQLSDAEFLTELELGPVNWETRDISSREKAARELAEQTSRPLANGDFSAGIQGWTPEGGISDAAGIYTEPTGPAFTTYAGHKDLDTGRLYQCFMVPKDAASLQFSIKGGSDEKRLYVALWRQGHVWKHVTARNDSTFIDVQWDLTPLRGEVVSLEIVDHSRTAWGFISVRDFVIVRQ
jgi:tetratricopeptide (TPR) repeat protein